MPPSTLARYLACWQTWVSFAEAMQVCAYTAPAAAIADFLHVHSSRRSGAAVQWLKAFSWFAKHAVLELFQANLQLPLLKAYNIAVQPTERRESAPFCMSFVLWLETQILQGRLPARACLEYGFLLVCVWGSLRWSDAQWVSPSSLSLQQGVTVGVASRTKTTTRGMPFRVYDGGLLGRPGYLVIHLVFQTPSGLGGHFVPVPPILS